MKIRPLSPNVVKKLRSGIAFLNVAHCVEELVLNSIDADATCIAVNLNLPLYQIQVIDNGNGIDAEQMKVIGTRYATSKCHSLKDLQNLKSGGFRGEALSSLKEVSSVLMIESRAASSTKTFCKIFTQGKSSDPKKSLNARPSKGTTVSVYDFMYNLPVRKKSISDALDVEECRKFLQSIALMYPNVSFTLKNEATSEMCLQLKKCTSLYHSFTQMFGKDKATNLKNIEYQKDCYAVTGCVSTDCHVSKDLQFLYVNKRHVLRTKLHKLINNILNKALSSRQKSNVVTNSLSPDKSGQPNQCYCIFALNITCPYDKYDIIFEPRKTMIEFFEWDSVLNVVEDSVIEFLKREKLLTDIDETESNILNPYSGDLANASNFNVQDCRQGLFSHVARRLLDPVDSNINLTTADNNTGNSNNHSADVSNTAMSRISGTEIPSNFFNDNGSPSKGPGLMHSEKHIRSSHQGSGTCLDKDKFNGPTSEFVSMNKPVSKVAGNFLPQKFSEQVEFGIPCRTVFPSENPIMLRVPIKSTLSDLKASCGSSKFSGLKERLQGFARKEKTHLLVKNKSDRRHKVSLKLCDISEKSHRKESLEKTPSLCFDVEKYETRLKEFNQLNFVNKSSQCPSVSIAQNITRGHCEKANDMHNKNCMVRVTEDKSVQCPSVSADKPAKIVSRFEFKESTMSPFQRLKNATRLRKRPSSNNYITIDAHLLDSLKDKSEIGAAKKLKPSDSSLVENSPLIINMDSEETGITEKDIEEFSEVITGPEKPVNIYCDDTNEIHRLSETFNLSPIISGITGTKQNKITSLNHLESSFSLQTFGQKSKYLENFPILTEFEDNFCLKQNESLYQNFVDRFNHVSKNEKCDSPNFPADSEVICCIEEIVKQVQVLSDGNEDFKGDVGISIAENMHVEFNTLDISNENIEVVPETASLNLDEVEFNVHDSYFVNSKNDSPDLKDERCVKGSKIMKCIESESTDFKLQHEMISNHLIASPDEPQFDNSASLLAVEQSSISNINFESNPFTLSLPLMSEGTASKVNESLEKIHDRNKEIPSNCSSGELFMESDFSELPDQNVEVSVNKELISNNPDVSDLYVLAHSSMDKNAGIKLINEDLTGLKSESSNLWKLHLEPNTKKKIYVNRVTGNSSCISPKVCGKDVDQKSESGNGAVKRSHFFLTHDYSPFVSKTQTSETNLKDNAGVQNDLTNFIVTNEKCEWHVKWRYSQQSLKCDDNSIENMLIGWENPMFDIPYEATSVADNKVSHDVSQMYSFLNSYRFSKSTLHSLEVIGQVDCKFIACILKDYNENCRDEKLLSLFDQHAVHERIRLEELIEDLYETDKNGEKSVKTVPISPSLEVCFNDEEIRLLHTYCEKLNKIGIHLKMDDESHKYSVASVPSCLVYKGTNQLRRSVSDSIMLLQNAISEWLSSLVKTRSIPQVLPKTLVSVLNFQACRGAVKFGDPLTIDQCSDLLKALSNCKLPFQCAHGRPSIAPILDLKKIERLYKKRSPPQLHMLVNQIQK